MNTIIPQKYCYACKQHLPLDSFTNNRSRYDGKASECRDCKKKAGAAYKRPNPSNAVMRIVGMKHADYKMVHEQQQGKCAICGKTETARNQWGVKKLAVDHDHTTDKFRGLLCQACNLKLAVLEDTEFVNAALVYLGKQ